MSMMGLNTSLKKDGVKLGLFIAVVIWFLIFVITSIKPFFEDEEKNIITSSHCERLQNELNNVNNRLSALIFESEKFEKSLDSMNISYNYLHLKNAEKPLIKNKKITSIPITKAQEVGRRRLNSVIQDLFYYFQNYFEMPVNSQKKLKETFRTRIFHQMLSLMGEAENLSTNIEGVGDWHKISLQKLTNRIQQTIYNLQHPQDCSKAKFSTCVLNKNCGFGCQIHHVTYCLLTAAASNRTLVLENNGAKWRYSSKGWNAVFKPLTNCSASFTQNTGSENLFNNINQSERVVRLPIIDFLSQKFDYLPLSFPKQFEEELLTHHSNPTVFFISQFLWYLMQHNDVTERFLVNASKNIPFDKELIVGLQIRRTDKINSEASYHSVEEYMKWTELWFRLQETRNNDVAIPRQIFVATDDFMAINEIKKKYPNYQVYYNNGVSETAQLSNRYSDSSLLGILMDLRTLSKCKYLVCTFSSQICRIAYELMQVLQGDVADNYHSLDDIYYFGGQTAHNLIAIGNYKTNSSGEIDLIAGDNISVAGNKWNGFLQGLNLQTGKSGLFPSYLTRENWKVVDFPIFN